MDNFRIEYDLSQIKELQNAIAKMGIADENTLPATSQAFYSAAQYTQNIWSNYLYGGQPLQGLDPIDKPLKPKEVGFQIEKKGAFHTSVKTNSSRVEEIQKGSNPVFYDMKQTHPYGRKSRVTQSEPNKGVPYLIIPFRWGTPNGKGTKRRWNNIIPQKEYSTYVKDLQLSETNKIKNYFEKNFKGENIERAGYNWAKFGRLTETQAWDERSVGMVRMRDVRNSTYFTFRIISAKSPANKWLYWKDGKNAVDMMGALEKTVKPGIEKIIESGIKADLGL